MAAVQVAWHLIVANGITKTDIEGFLNKIGNEWSPLEFLEAGGAMAANGLALHCRSNSPMLDVHIKIYLPADKGSGLKEHLRRGSAERILRLYHRFEELISETKVETVPIHGLHHANGALVVIMECVTNVDSLFGKDVASLRADTPRALRNLDTQQQWLHFDLCPKNVGKTSTGDYCYLDLESLYKVGEKGVQVSDPLTKARRIPENLSERLIVELASRDGLSIELAIRFQNHQLARLAVDMCAGIELSGADVENIITDHRLGDTQFWDKHFAQIVQKDKAPEPNSLADAIEVSL